MLGYAYRPDSLPDWGWHLRLVVLAVHISNLTRPSLKQKIWFISRMVPSLAQAASPARILTKNAYISSLNRNSVSHMAKDRFDIKEKEGVSFMTDAIVIVDKETGVNYLFVCRGYGGGLTPLLDADGKPIITKDGYKK